MIVDNEQFYYEIEIILNQNLYKRKVIAEAIYKATNERLIKLVEVHKAKNYKR